ncbi:EscV/YscV/HrcV family type III secretion system export apparatus protein [Erwiniaceae bacterium BAC15a-03b]|uniref:EscV/YscV/HrcV family type III secretion system export apparatus protein n=1 Tax=Winslowiella arboricola TaxID=2978220 RepID=A0A9J6PLN2_9GAMM|nr:EscV/YscV/HrcV family type III secretion system export apparatus protein [Winslowiella arboricola]MCU5773768.1 EscV/YscV/HrcV family type III secretion system export apparatus protein [Winslowiella arboricola]MCU5777678.1 EscV/YscV/HrcV family type III secretion system export apparatus protein [Winslowiella arboricola]
MVNDFIIQLRKHPELFILLLVVVIIAMLVIPLPTYLIDFLIGLNIVISALVFLSSFYIDRILSFSSFPAVLLITTLFRLALSISTSRLILNDADAGEIIATFGLFVIGDNLVVGFVIFAIVTIVQFMVITKGAERVAEVAARFSLDGMPGKQMSIDADLRANTIDADEAMQRRSILEKESQLYGSFDGAMKFIKGDAIAGILVIFVNFIGGISVGVNQHGMDMSTALSTYTMLTIGDGLVAQIPSLLIAISAGFIVTRVGGEGDNMGITMMSQLVNNPFVLAIAAIIAMAIGFLPGFPLLIFMLLALIPGGLFFVKWREGREKDRGHKTPRQKQGMEAGGEEKPAADAATQLGLIDDLDQVTPLTIPFIVRASPEGCEYLNQLDAAGRFRSQFFVDYGIHLPAIVIRAAENQQQDKVALLINEIQAEQFDILFDQVTVVNVTDELAQLGIDSVTTSGAVWVAPDQRQMLSELGYHTRTPVDELYYCIANTLVRNVSEYFGVQETKSHIDKLEKDYPDLIKEVMRHITVQRASEVMQRLLGEKISVRNTKLIMESLAVWAPREKDVITLVEHVRTALSRYISHKFAVGDSLKAVLISAEMEETLRQGIRTTATGSFLNLEPAVSEKMMDTFTLGISDILMSQKDYVILASVDIRRFVKRFLENKFKNLEVLSFGEISEGISIDVIKSIQ